MLSKVTVPSLSAKSVSSFPFPTLIPGKKDVPLWRIKIDPAVTFSPPYAFTPNLLEFESLPFLVDPVPFYVPLEVFNLWIFRILV